ncbi:MAG: dehydrogenase [Chloroflexi bacterium]|nr:dehydrogenase [Chloroflexota bacterium]
MRIAAPELEAITVRLLQAWRVPVDAARTVADHLVESSLAGVDSHGIMRLPQYLDAIEAGEIDVDAPITPVLDRGSIVAFEANHAFGPVAGMAAAQVAAERAQSHGLSLVVMAHAGHAGRIGAYTGAIAEQGVLALAFCNSPVYGHFIAPPGSRTGRLATNPIAYGFPTLEGPVVADFATGSMPEGVVRLLRDRGNPAPPDMMLDARGEPTTDAGSLYTDPPGVILPLGGARNGHKGFALGLLVEVLAGTLAGDKITDPNLRGNNLTFICIDVRATPAAPHFQELAAELVAYVHAAAPIREDGRVMVPGEKEQRTRAERLRSGIPVDSFTWEGIASRAARLGVPLPFVADEEHQ